MTGASGGGGGEISTVIARARSHLGDFISFGEKCKLHYFVFMVWFCTLEGESDLGPSSINWGFYRK